jgi:lipoate-protein ligase A
MAEGAEGICIRSGPGGAAWNMAFDEAMLVCCGNYSRPMLRFYAWREKAVSFGYFQQHEEIAAAAGDRLLVRRSTGGGLVDHAADWTYSLTYPPGHARYRCRAEEGYRLLHEAVAVALGRCGVQSRLAEECEHCGVGRCFVGHEKHDVIDGQGKIAGAAQRRTRQGLLIQGSLRPPPGIERAVWENAFLAELMAAPELVAENSSRLAPLRRVAQRLVAEKYSRDSYLRRR